MTAPEDNSESRSDPDDRLAQLAESLASARRAGGLVDIAAEAARHGVAARDVERALAALEAFADALADDEAEPPADELPPPSLPEDYELIDELGRGGMGVVYRARQRSLGREVAVKVLRPGELLFGDAIRRFEREARSLAKLRHRHIVAIHEVGRTGGNLYYTMDLIEGASLAELIQRDEVTPERAVRLLRQVTSAIAFTHGHGVIHRDLKPANILVDTEGDAYVADFGLARDVSAVTELTGSGHLLGTPAYMSPEQARGDAARIGAATDIYSLGAILYACLTGGPPFGGRSLAETMHAVLHEEPAPPRRKNPRVPRDLEVICLKALAKDPERRYPTARALLEDLERFEEGRPIRAQPPSVADRSRRWLQRNRVPVGVALGAALLAWGVFAIALHDEEQDNRNSLRWKAQSLAESGDRRGALALFSQAVWADPRSSTGREIAAEMLRCQIEEGEALIAAGQPGEATAVLAKPLDFLRDERHRTWPVPPELLWALAGCQARAGDWEGAADTFNYLHNRFLRKLVADAPAGSTVTASPDDFARIHVAPALFDRAAPEHEVAAMFVVTMLVGPSRDAAIHWIVDGLGQEASSPDGEPSAWTDEERADLIATLLEAMSDAPQASRAGLFEAMAEVLTACSGPVLERRMAQLVEVADTEAGTRSLALELLCMAADLPVRIDRSSDGDAADSLQLWKECSGLPRSESFRRRVGFAVARVASDEAVDPWTAQWLVNHSGFVPPEWSSGGASRGATWTAWWDAHGAEEPSRWLAGAIGTPVPEGDLAEELGRFLRQPGRLHAWRHHLLELCAPEGVRTPAWRSADAEPDRLAMAWFRQLGGGLPAERYRLRVAEFLPAVAHIEPVRLWEDSIDLEVGEPVTLRFDLPADPSIRAALVTPGLMTRPETFAAPMRSALVTARLSWTRGALVLRIDGFDILVRGSGWSSSHSSFGGGQTNAGAVCLSRWPISGNGLAIASDYGGSVWLAVAEPAASASVAPWTWDDWRRHVARDVSELVAAVESAGDAFERRAWLEAHSAQALTQIPRLAVRFPVPEAAGDLARLQALGRELGWNALDDLLPARAFAGDPTLFDEPEWSTRLTDAMSEVRAQDAQDWVRLLLDGSDPRVRALALERLEPTPYMSPAGAVALDQAYHAGTAEIPDALHDYVHDSELGDPWWENEDVWAADLPALGLYLVAAVAAALALDRRRLPSTRRCAAAWLVAVGYVCVAFSLDVHGWDWLPDVVGYGLALLGTVVIARGGQGRWRLLSPLGLAVALVADGLVALELLPHGWLYAAQVGSAAGLLGLPLQVRALRRAAPYDLRRKPIWTQAALWVFYGVPAVVAAVLPLTGRTLEQVTLAFPTTVKLAVNVPWAVLTFVALVAAFWSLASTARRPGAASTRSA